MSLQTPVRTDGHATSARFEVAGVSLDATDMTRAGDWLAGEVAGGARSTMVFCTASTVVCAHDDARLGEAIRAATMVVADGMPLVWAGRRTNPGVGRVYGPEFMLHVMGTSPDLTHYFYGGQPGVTEEMVARLRRAFPHLRVAGLRCPGRIDSQAMCPGDVAAINETKPDVVWVGLGHPKQELWMHAHRPLLDAPVLAGVGAAFDFLSGRKNEAPRWMKDSGLQWLHRLASEPKRLGKRYVVGNSRFIGLVLAEHLRNRSAA